MRILIVDDEISLLEQLQQILQKERYTVETAADGERALDKIFEASFDLIILDIMMPEIDGLEVLEHIRKAKIDTPVLMLTARGDIEDKIKGLDLGADDYMPKPVNLRELSARVSALLRRCSRRSEADCRNTGVSSRP